MVTCTPVSGQSSYHRNVGRSQSLLGDYRLNMDTVNYLRPDTPTPNFQPTLSLSDFDRVTLEQMGLSPGQLEPPSSVAVQERVETPVPQRGIGGDRSGSGSGRDGGGGGGCGLSVYNSIEESIDVAKAWDAITSDAAIGMEAGFWARILEAFNNFKPDDAPPWKSDQIRKM